jgi:hypothetical protein
MRPERECAAMQVLPVIVAALVVCLGCDPTGSASASRHGCNTDSDCKGARICSAGACIDPAPPSPYQGLSLPTAATNTASPSLPTAATNTAVNTGGAATVSTTTKSASLCNNATQGRSAGICSNGQQCTCRNLAIDSPYHCQCETPPARGTCGDTGIRCGGSTKCCHQPHYGAPNYCAPTADQDDLICDG